MGLELLFKGFHRSLKGESHKVYKPQPQKSPLVLGLDWGTTNSIQTAQQKQPAHRSRSWCTDSEASQVDLLLLLLVHCTKVPGVENHSCQCWCTVLFSATMTLSDSIHEYKWVLSTCLIVMFLVQMYLLLYFIYIDHVFSSSCAHH